jgi:hypothetical protein
MVITALQTRGNCYMLRELERFTAREPNGKTHTVSCFQEIHAGTEITNLPVLSDSRFFKTTDGIFLKPVNDFTFRILGSGRFLYKHDQQD